MLRIARSVLLIVGLVAGARQLAAQDHTLGLNLRVLGTAQIGLTILTSPAIAVRPSLSAGWAAVDFSGFGSVETSRVALDVDVLLRAATWDRVTLYSGPGVSIGRLNPSTGETTTVWGLRYLLGARLRVVDRVMLFGEAALEYDYNGDGGESAALVTLPLGIIVFLK